MGGYLDTYGAGEEKREKTVRTLAFWVGLALVIAAVLYFIFHFVIPNRSERGEVNGFFQLLAAHDYKQAYAMWGCTDAAPCRDYPFTSFLQDWGPEAVPVTTFQVLDGESCGSGVIVDVDAGKAGDKKLWVERSNRTLGFLPPGMERCPRGNRIYDFVRDIRYRLHGKTYK
ncbi:MAG: hypothetical protein LAQ30_26155 [Acidobacteriia bacterium]|nr:hypothetical protein [Terriglobia bacterium]